MSLHHHVWYRSLGKFLREQNIFSRIKSVIINFLNSMDRVNRKLDRNKEIVRDLRKIAQKEKNQ